MLIHSPTQECESTKKEGVEKAILEGEMEVQISYLQMHLLFKNKHILV